MQPKHILAYMDFMCPTGFGTVAHNVMDRLTPWFKERNIKVDILSLNFSNKEVEKYNECITAINPRIMARNMEDVYYRDGVLKALQIGEYDLLWMMNDVPVLGPMSRLVNHIRDTKEFEKKKVFKSVIYFPIDSVPYQRYFPDLAKFDDLYTYTDYGRKEAIKALQESNIKRTNIGIIPHGTDLDTFKKLKANKDDLREKYQLPKGRFLYGHINKNQPRKDFGTTLIAFRNLLDMWEGDEKPALYLHCYHSDKSGIKIHIACERLNLEVGKDVFLPIEDKYVNDRYTRAEINELYNAMDCFVTTTMAEGWGLTVTEAMAVGLPIVCGNHTSLKEITNDGKLVYIVNDLVEHIQIEDAENIRHKLMPMSVANQMKRVYDDTQKGCVKANYDSKLKEFDWDAIAEIWKGIIKKNLK